MTVIQCFENSNKRGIPDAGLPNKYQKPGLVPLSPSRSTGHDGSLRPLRDRSLANGCVSGINLETKPWGEIHFGPKDVFLAQIQKAAASSNFLPE